MAHILIVDDESDVVDMLADELESEKFVASKASNGIEAVLRVLDGGIDVVLMDIRMPGLDGIGALRIIHRIDPKLPVIMFTGQAGQGEMLESDRLGAFTCLLKPILKEKLLATLQQVV